MLCRHVVRAWVCVAMVALSQAVGRAGITSRPLAIVTGPVLKIASQSVQLDLPGGQADFSLTFDHPPDFDHPDSLGRRHDSFQYEIAPSLSDIQNADLFAITAVVRGDEIGATLLPIRAGVANGIDPTPVAGGWGPLIGSVPYHLNGSNITFAAPLDLLGTPDGNFGYRVFTTNYGSTVSLQTGSAAVSLPRAVWGGLVLLLGLVLWIRRHEMRDTRHQRKQTRAKESGSSLRLVPGVKFPGIVSPDLVSRGSLSRVFKLPASVRRSVVALCHSLGHSPTATGR